MKEKKKHKLTQENKQNNSLLFSSLHKTILKYEAVFLDFFFFVFNPASTIPHWLHL